MGNPAGMKKKLREKRRKKHETRLLVKELTQATQAPKQTK